MVLFGLFIFLCSLQIDLYHYIQITWWWQSLLQNKWIKLTLLCTTTLDNKVPSSTWVGSALLKCFVCALVFTSATDWLEYSYHVRGITSLQGKRRKKTQLSSTCTSINTIWETLTINESLKWGTKVNFFNASN